MTEKTEHLPGSTPPTSPLLRKRQQGLAVADTVAATTDSQARPRTRNDFLDGWTQPSLSAIHASSVLVRLSQEQIGIIGDAWRKCQRPSNRGEGVNEHMFFRLLWIPLVDTGNFDFSGKRNAHARRRLFAFGAAARKLSLQAGSNIEEAYWRIELPFEKDTQAVDEAYMSQEEIEALQRKRKTRNVSDLELFLRDLFASIDTKRIGVVSWEDFVTYMVERVFMHDLGSEQHGAGHGGSSSSPTAEGMRFDSTSEVREGGGSLLFSGDFPMREPKFKQHWIHRLEYFPAWGAVAALNRDHASIALMENITGSRESADLYEGTGNINAFTHHFGHEGPVTACEHVPSLGLFVTSSVEEHPIRIWGIHLRKELKLVRHCALRMPLDCTSIRSLRCFERETLPPGGGQQDSISPEDPSQGHSGTGIVDPHLSKFLMGTDNGWLLGLRLEEMDVGGSSNMSMSRPISPSFSYKFHRDCITDILPLSRLNRVVTASLDGQLYSHALDEDEVSRTRYHYRGHEKGITSLTYCSSHEIIVSAGFEYKAYCWAENLPTSPPFYLIDTVAPNTAPIHRVMAVEGTPQVYTMDVEGVVKLFDVRTLRAVGSWKAFDQVRVPVRVLHDISSGRTRTLVHEGDVGAACYTGPLNRSLLIGAKKCFLFHTETHSSDVDRAHDLAETMIDFDCGIRHMISATHHTVRRWDSTTGMQQQSHHALSFSSSPITVVKIDDVSSKVLTGHTDGMISVFSISTNVLLRRYHRHSAPVCSLAVDKMNHIIISGAVDGETCFWRDLDGTTSPIAHDAQLRFLYDELRPIRKKNYREVPPFEATDPRYLKCFQREETAELRSRKLAWWVLRKWSQRIRNAHSYDKHTKEHTLTCRTPFAEMYTHYPSKEIIISPFFMTALILSGRSTCRIIDYSTKEPQVTHRMNHGRRRLLLSTSYWAERNLVATSDSFGFMFLWVAPPGHAAVLLSAWRNRCLVSSFRNPLKSMETEDPDEGVYDGKERYRTVKYESEGEDDDIRIDPGSALAAVPSISAMMFETKRQYLVTGDDVGFISLWECERCLSGTCDWREILYRCLPSGTPARWIFAWHAHPHPIVGLNFFPHTTYSIISYSSDNLVSFWSVNGVWMAGLRQGPVVDRVWPFPDHIRERVALLNLRLQKLQACIRSGEVTAIGEAWHPRAARLLARRQRRERKSFVAFQSTNVEGEVKPSEEDDDEALQADEETTTKAAITMESAVTIRFSSELEQRLADALLEPEVRPEAEKSESFRCLVRRGLSRVFSHRKTIKKKTLNEGDRPSISSRGYSLSNRQSSEIVYPEGWAKMSFASIPNVLEQGAAKPKKRFRLHAHNHGDPPSSEVAPEISKDQVIIPQSMPPTTGDGGGTAVSPPKEKAVSPMRHSPERTRTSPKGRSPQSPGEERSNPRRERQQPPPISPKGKDAFFLERLKTAAVAKTTILGVSPPPSHKRVLTKVEQIQKKKLDEELAQTFPADLREHSVQKRREELGLPIVPDGNFVVKGPTARERNKRRNGKEVVLEDGVVKNPPRASSLNREEMEKRKHWPAGITVCGEVSLGDQASRHVTAFLPATVSNSPTPSRPPKAERASMSGSFSSVQSTVFQGVVESDAFDALPCRSVVLVGGGESKKENNVQQQQQHQQSDLREVLEQHRASSVLSRPVSLQRARTPGQTFHRDRLVGTPPVAVSSSLVRSISTPPSNQLICETKLNWNPKSFIPTIFQLSQTAGTDEQSSQGGGGSIGGTKCDLLERPGSTSNVGPRNSSAQVEPTAAPKYQKRLTEERKSATAPSSATATGKTQWGKSPETNKKQGHHPKRLSMSSVGVATTDKRFSQAGGENGLSPWMESSPSLSSGQVTTGCVIGKGAASFSGTL